MPLEQLFDGNDIPVKPTLQPQEEKVVKHNLGTSTEPQLVKLSKNLPKQEKHKYVDLFNEFKDVCLEV